MQDKPFIDHDDHSDDGRGQEKSSNLTVLNNVLDIDRAIIKLIGRRSHYIAMLRRHRGQRDAAAETNTERALRLSWEEAAQSVSTDPKLSRQLFKLLQEINPLSDHERQAQEGKEAFNLAPSPEPVDIALPLLPSLREAAFHVFLAVAGGSALHLPGQILSDALIDFVKGLNQVGGHLSWDADGNITNRAGSVPKFGDRVIYAGEDSLHFYLLCALALASPGKVKFTGGSGLKLADLSAWRNTLPFLGARQAHLVPKSNGLPVHIECSALFDESVELPEFTPADGLCALLLAAPFWGVPIKLDGAANPAWDAVLNEILPIFKRNGINFTREQSSVSFSGEKPAAIPENPSLTPDPLLSTLILSIAALNPGKVTLAGAPDKNAPGAEALYKLMDWAALRLEVKGNGLSVFRPERDKRADSGPVGPAPESPSQAGLLPEHAPVLLLLAAAKARDSRQAVPLPPLTFKADLGEDGPGEEFPLYAQEFLDLLGATYTPSKGDAPGTVRTAARLAPQSGAWTAPSPVWGICLALGAYLRPQIKLANPGIVTELMPNFWRLYNGLPKPEWQRRPKEEPAHEQTRRRRVIVD